VAEDRAFLKAFFQGVVDRPLEPDDPRYVDLYQAPALLQADPVELLATAIEFSPGESVQLLSGFRGTGKSTELKRLVARLLREGFKVIRRERSLPVSAAVVNAAIDQMRTEFLPLADEDAIWLAHIAETHEAALGKMDNLVDLTRFFDTHVVLCYRDGPEWYDVHPLIKEIACKQAVAVEARRKKASEPPPS